MKIKAFLFSDSITSLLRKGNDTQISALIIKVLRGTYLRALRTEREKDCITTSNKNTHQKNCQDRSCIEPLTAVQPATIMCNRRKTQNMAFLFLNLGTNRDIFYYFCLLCCTKCPYMPLKGPSQPHLCFCLQARVWLLCFLRSMSKRRKSLRECSR